MWVKVYSAQTATACVALVMCVPDLTVFLGFRLMPGWESTYQIFRSVVWLDFDTDER